MDFEKHARHFSGHRITPIRKRGGGVRQDLQLDGNMGGMGDPQMVGKPSNLSRVVFDHARILLLGQHRRLLSVREAVSNRIGTRAARTGPKTLKPGPPEMPELESSCWVLNQLLANVNHQRSEILVRNAMDCIMLRPIPGALILLCLAGCQNRKIVDDNPVLGPPPPRTTLDSGATPAGDSEIVQVASETAGTASLIDQLDERIVARINGQPVFAADVLRPYRPFIETQRNMLSRLSPEQREAATKQMSVETSQLLERALPDYIDREVVLRSIQRSLKKEQIEGIQQQIDSLFAERVDAIVEAAGLKSRAELEDLMTHPDHPQFQKMMMAWREGMGTAPSTSLSESREAFGKMAMAAEFLRAKANEPADIDRTDMLDYYRTHSDDYDVPLELQWQQIVISHDGDKEKAVQKMQAVLRRVRAGESFAALAKEHSSGPTASDGGVRDWIQKGSLVDSEIEEALFKLPKGEFSDVFERDGRFELVRVVDRRGGSRKSFESVQAEIRKTLLAELQQAAREKTLNKMREESDIVILLKSAQDKAETLPAGLFRANR